MAVVVAEQTTMKPPTRAELLEALFSKDQEIKALRKRAEHLEFLFSEKGKVCEQIP